jgi:phage shock protein A
MGVFQRVAATFTTRAHRVLDRFDEPAAPFDRARQLQLGLLTQARDRLTQLADEEAGRRVEAQQQQQHADQWERTAREQLAAGGEEAARAALMQRATALSRMGQLTREDEAAHTERDRLTDLIRRLEERLEEFTALAETVRAADATARADQAMAAIDAEADELRRATTDAARQAEPPDLDEEMAALEAAALVDAQLRWLRDDLRRKRRA